MLFSSSVTEPDVLCNALNISHIRLRWRHKIRKIAVEILQSVNNRSQSLREILRMVIIDRLDTLLGGLTLDPAGMHCPSYGTMLLFLVSFFVFLVIFLLPCLW